MSCQRPEPLFAWKLDDIYCKARTATPAATSGRSPERCEPLALIIYSACEAFPPPVSIEKRHVFMESFIFHLSLDWLTDDNMQQHHHHQQQ